MNNLFGVFDKVLGKIFTLIDKNVRGAIAISNAMLTVNYVTIVVAMVCVVLNHATWSTTIAIVASSTLTMLWLNRVAKAATRRSIRAFALCKITPNDGGYDQMATCLAAAHKLRLSTNAVTVIVNVAIVLLNVANLTYASRSLAILTASVTSLLLVLANRLSSTLNNVVDEALGELEHQLSLNR